jgi:hypothetical protein
MSTRPSVVFRDSADASAGADADFDLDVDPLDPAGFRRPVSMLLPRHTRFDTIAETTRNSDSAVSVSTRGKAKSRAQSRAQSRAASIMDGNIDFRSGVNSLVPYRSFYTNVTIEAKKLRMLDDVLANDFLRSRIVEEEVLQEAAETEAANASAGRFSLSADERQRESGSRPPARPPAARPPNVLGSLFKKTYSFAARPSSVEGGRASSARHSKQQVGLNLSSDSERPSVRPSTNVGIRDEASPQREPTIEERAMASQQSGSHPSSPELRPSSRDPNTGGRRGSRAFFFDLKRRLQTEDEKVTRAAVYIGDAIHERPIKTHRSYGRPMRVYSLLHGKMYRRVLQLMSVLHLALAFFEPHGKLPAGTVSYVNSLWESNTIDTLYTCLYVEGIIIVIYTIDVMLNMYSFGFRDYFGIARDGGRDSMRLKAIAQHIPKYSNFKYMQQFKFVACSIFAVDVALAFIYGFNAHRASRLFRPLYAIVWTPELRRWGMLIARTVPHVWELLVLLFVSLSVFAVTGVIMFGRKGVAELYVDDLQNFKDFPRAGIAMYVLFTTENYPDIMLPVYNYNKIYVIFFVCFLMLVMFFLGNLAVPTLYRAFKSNHHREALHGRILERTALLAAFQLLDTEKKGYIELPMFKRVLEKIRPDMFVLEEDPTTQPLQSTKLVEKERGIAKSMFRELALTDPNKEKISPIDFFRCCEVVLVTYKVSRSDSVTDVWSRLCESSVNKNFRAKLGYILESKVFDKVVLLTSLCMTILMAFYNTSDGLDRIIDNVGVTWVFISFFEMLFKMYVLGINTYLASWINQTDGMFAFLSMLGMTLGHYQQNGGLVERVFGENDLSRWFGLYGASVGPMFINMRTGRIVFRPQLLRKLRVVLTIYPFMLNSLALTLMFLYFWALGGMYMFAELDLESTAEKTLSCIHEYSPSEGSMSWEDEVGPGSSVDFSNFWASNLRLFQILTGSNWHLIMYSVMCSTGSKRHALYFILFHLVAVLILLQIVIAIYVEAFIAFQDKEEMREREREAENNILDSSIDERDEVDSSDRVSSRDTENILERLKKKKSQKMGNADADSAHTVDHDGDSTHASGKKTRRRVGSMPGFVSPLNAVARMDMPRFEESEIEVLRSLGPTTLNLREAAEEANRRQEEDMKDRGYHATHHSSHAS